MARKQQNDPLRYAANLTALAAAVYLGVTALLRLAVGQLLRLFNKSATLENPIAVPEWVLGVFNVLLPAAGLAAAFWLLAVGVRATPMRLRISVQMPRDGRGSGAAPAIGEADPGSRLSRLPGRGTGREAHPGGVLPAERGHRAL